MKWEAATAQRHGHGHGRGCGGSGTAPRRRETHTRRKGTLQSVRSVARAHTAAPGRPPRRHTHFHTQRPPRHPPGPPPRPRHAANTPKQRPEGGWPSGSADVIYPTRIGVMDPDEQKESLAHTHLAGEFHERFADFSFCGGFFDAEQFVELVSVDLRGREAGEGRRQAEVRHVVSHCAGGGRRNGHIAAAPRRFWGAAPRPRDGDGGALFNSGGCGAERRPEPSRGAPGTRL